eukprot:CAMPEP_0114609084 /NCGR_PEP_ID=MMETSP0168-20121206/2908_1 /TAXON_ID=95228 ORGANISM="Vannella sp., Strain DIVA3 517/6/12" /NCGR_SAMPLE_ID=MMETSP0168 /ASSEMBLY_ACC=CAM_ASM_000044 /LENGTH=851 /DNA_ID=CAMNT_0001819995 /DNA_START=199 /DNA_END=2751 /DNA_ORIENTATION=-
MERSGTPMRKRKPNAPILEHRGAKLTIGGSVGNLETKGRPMPRPFLDEEEEQREYSSSLTASSFSSSDWTEEEEEDLVHKKGPITTDALLREAEEPEEEDGKKKKKDMKALMAATDLPAQAAVSKKAKKKKKKKFKPIGKVITKGDKSYELMFSMLLGIRVAVSQASAKRIAPELSRHDAREVQNYFVPSSGTDHTPAHLGRDFKFRDYAPKVFRHLREKNGIDSADYLISLTGDYVLSEIISPGKSGMFLYFSHDTQFILKTITPLEKRFFKRILLSYSQHILTNPNTLVIKFYGFHMVQPRGYRKMHFVVMGNVFAQSLAIHERYDLKGSTVGRTAGEEKVREGKASTVYKDLDFQRALILGPEKAAQLTLQLERDVHFLDRMDIMDYSLLVGVHSVTKKQELQLKALQEAQAEDKLSDISEISDVSEEADDPRLLKSIFTLDRGGYGATDQNNQPVPEIYFLGVIDILQPYNLAKQAEHAWKARVLQMDRYGISAVDPHVYGLRFLRFIKNLISTEDAAELRLLYEREEQKQLEITSQKTQKKLQKEMKKEMKKEKKMQKKQVKAAVKQEKALKKGKDAAGDVSREALLLREDSCDLEWVHGSHCSSTDGSWRQYSLESLGDLDYSVDESSTEASVVSSESQNRSASEEGEVDGAKKKKKKGLKLKSIAKPKKEKEAKAAANSDVALARDASSSSLDGGSAGESGGEEEEGGGKKEKDKKEKEKKEKKEEKKEKDREKEEKKGKKEKEKEVKKEGKKEATKEKDEREEKAAAAPAKRKESRKEEKEPSTTSEEKEEKEREQEKEETPAAKKRSSGGKERAEEGETEKEREREKEREKDSEVTRKKSED